MSNKFLEITAILLQFVSFWLVAPEILGERVLRRAEPAVRYALLATLIAAIVVSVQLVAAVAGRTWGYDIWLTYFEPSIPWLARWYGTIPSWVKYAALVTLAIPALLWALRNERRRLRDGKPPTRIQRALQRLSENQGLRTRCLALGAILFTAGFGIQLFVLVRTPD